MASGKFMVFNGIATLVAVKIGFEMDMPGQMLGIGALVYFWGSLYFYTEWFRWNSDLHGMTDGVLRELLDEWEGGGPFGRNTPEISRLMLSEDPRKKALGARRLGAVYEELARRETNGDQARLTRLQQNQHRWVERANELQKHSEPLA